MKTKVCGLASPENIGALTRLGLDYMGFIFYPKSPRFMVETVPASFLKELENVKKVGVFVNEEAELIAEVAKKYHLDTVQLHGKETAETCKILKDKGFEVFKVFSVDQDFDFKTTEPYLDVADYFLFDTKTPKHGGSGKKFNWEVLFNYIYDKPFFLSGGIGPDDVMEVKKFNHPQLAGVDLNSKFETEPGVKDVSELSMFLFAFREE